MGDEARTLWCGNLSEKVTEELLYELFLQVAPLERVRIPTDKDGRKSNFAFITLKHEVSVNYVVQLLDGTPLYDRRITIKPRTLNQNQLTQRNEHQNSLMHNFNELFLMGQMMQVTYSNCLQRYTGRPIVNRRDDSKSYNKHHNRHNSHNSGRQGWNHQRNTHQNYNDRNRRQRYY